jgi:hypothetical protein
VPILAKDEEKQRAIREKANIDAQSSQARSIGAPSPANATRGVPPNVKPDASRKLAAVAKTPTAGVTQGSSTIAPKTAMSAKAGGATEAGTKKPTINMFIQAIPPFRGNKPKSTSSTTNGAQTTASTNGSVTNTPASPTAARLNANASSFRPNPKASAFTPVRSNLCGISSTNNYPGCKLA